MKNLDDRVKCIKVYTDGKSAEIQKKLFELGVRWALDGNEVLYLDETFLYVDENGVLTSGTSMTEFKEHRYKEVDCLDVLSWEVRPQSQLRPFQKVLVRDFVNEKWKANFYSYAIEFEVKYKYRCVTGSWYQCIPYEGNEHLLGTTDSPHKEAGN